MLVNPLNPKSQYIGFQLWTPRYYNDILKVYNMTRVFKNLKFKNWEGIDHYNKK